MSLKQLEIKETENNNEIERCELLGCELEKDSPTLQELIDTHTDEAIRGQAKLLIQLGHKSSDKLCPTCFWK